MHVKNNCPQKMNTNLFLQHPPQKNNFNYLQVLASTHNKHPYRQCICIIYTCTWYVCSQQNTPTLAHKVTQVLEFSLKSCHVGLEFHLLFGALSPIGYCLQSQVIRDQTLKLSINTLPTTSFSPHKLPTYNLCYVGFKEVQGAHGDYRLRVKAIQTLYNYLWICMAI